VIVAHKPYRLIWDAQPSCERQHPKQQARLCGRLVPMVRFQTATCARPCMPRAESNAFALSLTLRPLLSPTQPAPVVQFFWIGPVPSRARRSVEGLEVMCAPGDACHCESCRGWRWGGIWAASGRRKTRLRVGSVLCADLATDSIHRTFVGEPSTVMQHLTLPRVSLRLVRRRLPGPGGGGKGGGGAEGRRGNRACM